MASALITRGEDRTLTLRLVYLEGTSPFDLTGWTKISVFFKKSDRTNLEKDTSVINVKASSEYDGVNYTAVTGGVNGNSISLVFDGVKDIATIISDWNTANPTNTVSSDASDDTVIPTSKTLTLLGGKDNFAYVALLGDPVLGKITVNLNETDTATLKTGPSQAIKAVIDFGNNKGGQRRIVIFDNAINVVDANF